MIIFLPLLIPTGISNNSATNRNLKDTACIAVNYYRAILCIVQIMLLQDVCPSVHLPNVSILSKWSNVSSNFIHLWVATPF